MVAYAIEAGGRGYAVYYTDGPGDGGEHEVSRWYFQPIPQDDEGMPLFEGKGRRKRPAAACEPRGPYASHAEAEAAAAADAA